MVMTGNTEILRNVSVVGSQPATWELIKQNPASTPDKTESLVDGISLSVL